MSGTLYLVGTPSGNLVDLSVRALETLRSADFIAAEDTRVTGRLLAAYGIEKRLERLDGALIGERAGPLVRRVLDGGGITPGSAKALINRRLLTIAGIDGIPNTAAGDTDGIEWCTNGCLNTNSSSTYPYAINHEKFVTISDTIWDGASGSARAASSAMPAVISSSWRS